MCFMQLALVVLTWHFLGVIYDKTCCKPGRYRLESYDMLWIPAREHQPELEWMDDKTPVLYYGE